MTDQGRKRPSRGYAASRFDEITLAAFTALVIAVVAAVFIVGVATAEDRIGCGLTDIVYPGRANKRACR